MAKFTPTPILAGYDSVSKLNDNFNKISDALEKTVSRDGTTPNSMSTDLDMNHFSIQNVGAPSNANDLVRLTDLQSSLPALGGSSLITMATAAGAAMIGAISTGAGSILRTVQDKLRDWLNVKDYGALGDGIADDSPAFTSLKTVTSRITVPAGTYKLNTNVTIGGSYSWRKDPASNFTGAGNLLTPDNPGFNYALNLKNVNNVDSLGPIAAPVTTVDPVTVISKNSNTPDIGGGINAALVVQHNHYGTVGQSKAQGGYYETVVRIGGPAVFGEGIRTHCIVPTGITGKAYGGVAYAQNAGPGLNTIGWEAETRRITGVDCPIGRDFTSGSQLDAPFAATINTADGLVGGLGGKASAAFYVNPFNTEQAQTGFWVPKSVKVGGKTVAHTAFGCQEQGLVYGLDLAKGSYSFAAISIPNNVAIRAMNAAGTSEKNVLALGTDDSLYLGSEATLVRLAAPPVFTLSGALAPGNNGDMTIERTSNTALTFRLKGTDGVVRSGTLTLS